MSRLVSTVHIGIVKCQFPACMLSIIIPLPITTPYYYYLKFITVMRIIIEGLENEISTILSGGQVGRVVVNLS